MINNTKNILNIFSLLLIYPSFIRKKFLLSQIHDIIFSSADYQSWISIDHGSSDDKKY